MHYREPIVFTNIRSEILFQVLLVYGRRKGASLVDLGGTGRMIVVVEYFEVTISRSCGVLTQLLSIGSLSKTCYCSVFIMNAFPRTVNGFTHYDIVSMATNVF